ncbi:hypothetical protein ABT324_18295 [Saccharopolyspora sp. NPDC000359]|uniref:hypothetical protein n=1 Tax=Saccharopolyspora sp. NPDC000359 TaxID=3154251 RepID=UPI003324F886
MSTPTYREPRPRAEFRTCDLPGRTAAQLAALARSPLIALCGLAAFGDVATGTALTTASIALAAKPGPDPVARFTAHLLVAFAVVLTAAASATTSEEASALLIAGSLAALAVLSVGLLCAAAGGPVLAAIALVPGLVTGSHLTASGAAVQALHAASAGERPTHLLVLVGYALVAGRSADRLLDALPRGEHVPTLGLR